MRWGIGEAEQVKGKILGYEEMACGLRLAAGIPVSYWPVSVNSCYRKEDKLVLCCIFQVIYLPRW